MITPTWKSRSDLALMRPEIADNSATKIIETSKNSEQPAQGKDLLKISSGETILEQGSLQSQ